MIHTHSADSRTSSYLDNTLLSAFAIGQRRSIATGRGSRPRFDLGSERKTGHAQVPAAAGSQPPRVSDRPSTPSSRREVPVGLRGS